MVVSRRYRIGVLALVALGGWLTMASAVGATAVGATLTPGPLTLTPASVTLTYHAPGDGVAHRLTSSFAVTVTDATGTAAGWVVLAASAGAIGPQANLPDVDHAIIDFDVTHVSGTAPDPTCVCNTILTRPSVVLSTPPQTGIGRSTEVFTTQLTVPENAPRGRYTTTVLLSVAPLGAGPVNPLPGGRPTGPAAPPAPGSPAPAPIPTNRPAPVGGTTPTTPDPAPNAKPVAGPSSPSASVASALPSGTVREDGSDLPTSAPATAAPVTGIGITGSALPANGANTETSPPVAAVNNAAVVPTNPTAVATLPDVSSAGSAPALNTAAASVTPAVEGTYPVVTMMSTALSRLPSLLIGGPETADGAASWRLQATYAGDARIISRSAASRLPVRMNAGAFVIVIADTGHGQATVTFDPTQPSSEHPVMEAAVVVLSVVAGP